MRVTKEAALPSPVLARFYPALDGLRAIAFVVVFFGHYGNFVWGWRGFRWGWAGVDLFFVLSGFLITGILFDTLDQPHFFRNFYTRRTLRIFPLFYGFWLLMLLLTPVLRIDWNLYTLSTAAYIGNFFRAGGVLLRHPDSGIILCLRGLQHGKQMKLEIGPLWSLCVEEQFYLVWPAVVWTLRSRKKLLWLCIAIILVEPFARELYWHFFRAASSVGGIYFNTFTRIDTLLVGAVLALWLRGPNASAARVKLVSYLLIVPPLPILAALIRPHSGPTPTNWIADQTVVTIGFTLIALFGAGLLLLSIQSRSWLYRVLNTRLLVYIGRRTYGLYFFHGLPIYFMIDPGLIWLSNHHARFLFFPIVAAYSAAAAWLSFRYLESPFLRLKDRWAPSPVAVNDPPPAVAA